MKTGRKRSLICACCGVEKTDENTGRYRRGKSTLFAAYCHKCEADRVFRHNIRKMTKQERRKAIAKYQRYVKLLREGLDNEN